MKCYTMSYINMKEVFFRKTSKNKKLFSRILPENKKLFSKICRKISSLDWFLIFLHFLDSTNVSDMGMTRLRRIFVLLPKITSYFLEYSGKLSFFSGNLMEITHFSIVVWIECLVPCISACALGLAYVSYNIKLHAPH